jgi:hypothetical protein
MPRKHSGAALIAAVAAVVFVGPSPLRASSYLLFLELQGIAGYSTAAKKAVFASMNDMEAMQKPSLGFDYIQRVVGANRDIAVLAVQGRLAYNAEGSTALEPQLYNAYLKIKAGFADVWIGHNRPKFGLAAVFDTHNHLLQPLAMRGYGFERDWGVGVEKDYGWGSAGASLTTGSGMPLALHGNYFVSARVSSGVLERDNYSFGISAGHGRFLDVMGTHVMSHDTAPFTMAAFDISVLANAWEHHFECYAGGRNKQNAFAALWRAGRGFLDENRLRLEVQPAFILAAGTASWQLAAGATYIAHPDWTLRAMVSRDSETRDVRVIFQVYFYKGIKF